MSGDVGKVQGPVGPVIPKKDSSPADVEKFQAALREQTSKISAIDADEEKRRKRQNEAEEDSRVSTGQVARQAPEETIQAPPPFYLESQAHLQHTRAPLSSSPFSSERSSPVAAESPSSTSETPSPHTPTRSQAPASTPSHTDAPKKKKKPATIDSSLSLKPLTPTPQPLHTHPTPPTEQVIEKVTIQANERGPPPQSPDAPPKKSSATQKIPLENALPILASLAPAPPQEMTQPLEGINPHNPYIQLHPEIQALFARIVGVMSVMQQSGIKETSFILNMPQFASSVFFGSRIIIREFNTAAKAFNIEFSGSESAVGLFQANAGNLAAAFQAGNYAFRIHRIETSHVAERPLFKRKEGGQDAQQQQSGDSH